MAQTFFQDFNRDDGSPVTVEYSFAGGSPTTYSPAFGAVGGDGCEVEIVACWPNTPEHHDLCEQKLEVEMRPSLSLRTPLTIQAKLAELNSKIAAAEASCALTDAERQRMEAWLAEHHVDEPSDPED